LHTRSFDRTDTAEAVNYVSPNQETALNFQGSAVNRSDLHDIADGMTFTHTNLTNFNVFARYGTDSGSNVLDGGRAQRYEAGAGLFDASGANISGVVRKVGQYFDPEDGLVQHPDIAGYNINFFKPFRFATTARYTQFNVNGNFDRYHDHTGALDQTTNGLFVSLTTRTLLNFQASTGSEYVLFGNVFTPVTQQGVQFGYNLNGLLPSFVAFNKGRFGPGVLDSWTRSTTLRAGPRGTITAEADDTRQGTNDGNGYTEWLERLSYAYQSGPNQSFALGVRRIIGMPPQLIQSPSGIPSFESGWNLSAAFHKKVAGGEWYVVYGDAAAFATAPRFIIKYIKYIGADKGT
jgi:hypothetical protein